MSDHDFAFESQPGLPAPLPQGETLLWQGKPDTRALARESFKINWVFGYLMLIAIWRGGATLADAGIPQALAVFLPYAALAAAGYGVIYALAWASARATIYSITSARVIMRIGAALQVTYTVPFTRIATASANVRPGGTGTIALDLTEGARLSWLVLWPHVRPGFVKTVQPALRCIPDATQVARILADAAQTRLNEPVVALSKDTAPLAAE